MKKDSTKNSNQLGFQIVQETSFFQSNVAKISLWQNSQDNWLKEVVKTSCFPQDTLLNIFFLIRNLHYFMTWGVSTMPRPACSTSLSRSTRMCSTSTTTVWCPMRWRYSTGDSKYILYNKNHQSFISFRNGCGPKLENCLNNKEVVKEELWSFFLYEYYMFINETHQ